MISANEPFFGGAFGASFVGGGVGCPFLKEVVEVEGRERGCFGGF